MSAARKMLATNDAIIRVLCRKTHSMHSWSPSPDMCVFLSFSRERAPNLVSFNLPSAGYLSMEPSMRVQCETLAYHTGYNIGLIYKSNEYVLPLASGQTCTCDFSCVK